MTGAPPPGRVRVHADNAQGIDMEGTLPADEGLWDGVVEFIDDETGATLLLNGWLWIFNKIDAPEINQQHQ